MAEPVDVTPLPAPQVCLHLSRAVTLEDSQHAVDISGLPHLLGHLHGKLVGIKTSGLPLALSRLALRGLLSSLRQLDAVFDAYRVTPS